jgi:endonuclease/exonuclease/phosphatase family metal-dependent hydrolase
MLKKSLLITLFANVVIIIGCAPVKGQQRTIYSTNVEMGKTSTIQQAYPDSVLRVATLNLAHGRKDSFNRLFVGEDAFKENLNDIAEVLSQYKPHVVAFQEADEESRWNGSFDHVEYLASTAGSPWRIHESNADNWLFSFGTAVLSVLPMTETIKHTFESSPPTLDKGFVLAQIDWSYGDERKSRKLDILSVHLDFSRQSVRDQQIKEMIEILSTRINPTIIMGDFNSEWLAEASVIQELVTKTRYTTYKPESAEYSTYKNKRLDWILITKDMELINYQVLPDILSDHAMVVADVRFKADAGEVAKTPATEVNVQK